MNKYNVNEEIKKYYKISMFFNRYILILWSLLFSFVLMITFNTKDSDVLAYAKSDILINTFNENKVSVWKNIEKFNNSSNHIKANFLLTDSNYENLTTELWIWIFKDDYGIYYPMNININNIKLKNIKTKNDVLKNYIDIIWSSKEWDYKFIKPKLTLKNYEEIIKEYNLSCIDSSSNNFIFCKTNKSNLINDLINKNTFDITKNVYNKIFDSLKYTEEKKCDIIKQIYNTKYNINKISNVIEKNNCNMYNFKRADEFIINLIWNNEKLFNINDKLPESYDVLMQKLTQQFYILISQEEIPDYMLNNHIKLIENIIKEDNMDSSIATISKSVLLNLKNKSSFRKKSSYNNLISSIEQVISWQPELNIKWLNDYIKDDSILTISWENNTNIDWLQLNETVSERERVNNIFTNKYSNIFTITKKIQYNDETKTANIEWFINLIFSVDWIKENKKVKVSFDIKNIIWTNFDIYNIEFIDNKIANYIAQENINISPDSLIDLKDILENKLYAPLVNNNYWKNKDISICDKYKQLETSYSCSDGTISFVLNNGNITPSLKLEIDINNDLNIKSISVNNSKLTYKLNNLLEEELIIDIWGLIRSINIISKRKSYNVKQIPVIENIINSKINEKVDENEVEKSWMTKSEKIKLNNKFKEFLWVDIDLVREFKWYYKIFFKMKWETFYAIYNNSKNTIIWMVIYVPEEEKNFIFKNMSLRLASLDIEQLNSFKLEPLIFLKEKDQEKYNEYQTYIEEN